MIHPIFYRVHRPFGSQPQQTIVRLRVAQLGKMGNDLKNGYLEVASLLMEGVLRSAVSIHMTGT